MKNWFLKVFEKDTNENLSFKEITKKAGKSQGTVSVYLKELTESGIINRKLQQTELVFELVNSNYVKEVIAKHQTSLFERSCDFFSSLACAIFARPVSFSSLFPVATTSFAIY